MLYAGGHIGNNGSTCRKKGAYATDATVTLRTGMIVTAAMLMSAILHVHGLAAGHRFCLHGGYSQRNYKAEKDNNDTVHAEHGIRLLPALP